MTDLPNILAALVIWVVAIGGTVAWHYRTCRTRAPLPRRPHPVDALRQAIDDLEQCEAIWTATNHTRKGENK